MKLFSLILLALLPLASHALNYEQRVRHITGNNLIRHFDLTDRSGTAAVDRSPVGTNGTYTNSPTLSSIVGPDGKRAPLFDGVDQHIVLGDLSPLANSLDLFVIIWAKVSGSGVWTDGANREMVFLKSDSTNRIEMLKASTDNLLRMFIRAGGSNNTLDISSVTTTDWFSIGIEFSGTTHEVFFNGVSQGTINSSAWTGSGSWDGGWISRSDTNSKFWDGYLSNAIISDTALSPAAMIVLGKL